MEIDKSYYTRFSEYVLITPGWKNRWARIVSGVLSPLTISLVAVAVAGYAIKDESVLNWIALYVVLSILPPTLYIMYLVRKGTVSDFHLNVRTERTKPFLLMTTNSALGFTVMLLLGAPKLILIVLAAAVLQLLFMLIITLRWKISGHCTAIAGLVVLTIALFGENMLPLILTVPLVAWSRIRLKRHTFAQTLAGTGLGITTVGALLYFTNVV